MTVYIPDPLPLPPDPPPIICFKAEAPWEFGDDVVQWAMSAGSNAKLVFQLKRGTEFTGRNIMFSACVRASLSPELAARAKAAHPKNIHQTQIDEGLLLDFPVKEHLESWFGTDIGISVDLSGLRKAAVNR